MLTSLDLIRTSGQLQSGQGSVSVLAEKPHVIPLTSKFSVTLFSSHVAISMKPDHHFKQYPDPYHNRRGFLIGSPFNFLSSAPLHEPHKGAIIHHTPNVFCHFSLGWKIRARGAYWFYKKHEAETPEVECLPVIDNCFNNHDRQGWGEMHIWVLNIFISSSLFLSSPQICIFYRAALL